MAEAKRRDLNETSTGISFQDRIFMVAGYMEDYLKIPSIIDEVNETKPEHTYADLKDNRGYVDKGGGIWIYKLTTPGKSYETIPWFTANISNGALVVKYNPKRSSIDETAWRVEKIKDLTVKNIIETTSNEPVKYDEKIMLSVARATSVIKPEVSADDDFLKMIVKTVINEKDVNVNKYKATISPTWVVSNLINGLLGTTKTGPLTFLQFMDMLNCEFEVRIKDDGKDKDDPLKHTLIYDSTTNKIRRENDEENKEPNKRMARSIKA